MKKIYLSTLVILVFFFAQSGSSQHRWGPERGERQRPERLEKFRKMRLIEVLKLSEEDAVRFFAKQTAHEDKVHELMNSRNDVLDSIEANIKESDQPGDLDKQVIRLKEIDRNMFNERQRFQDEVRQLLTPVQFGKFLVFERDFGRQVRDAIQEMNQEKRNPPGE